MCVCLISQSCLTLCDPMHCSLIGSSVHGDSPSNNTRVGCHAILQGISPAQDLNPGLLHCRCILYPLGHQGIPRILQWVAYPFSRPQKVRLAVGSGAGVGVGVISWEIGIDIYTLLYTKQITNRNLLYSTGNTIQYSVMTYMGKEYEEE